MPIKWGPGQDHHLLLKILETQPSLKVDYEKVATAWSDGPTKPTARAIQERLATIRKLAKTGPGSRGTAAASNGVNPTATRAPIPATPKKNSKSGTGLPTPSTTKARSTTAASDSHKGRSFSVFDESKEDEPDFNESDSDESLEDISTLLDTPSKMFEKKQLRAIPKRKYVIKGEEAFGDDGSDDGDFDPNAERKMEERMARRRKGIVNYSSDEC